MKSLIGCKCPPVRHTSLFSGQLYPDCLCRRFTLLAESIGPVWDHLIVVLCLAAASCTCTRYTYILHMTEFCPVKCHHFLFQLTCLNSMSLTHSMHSPFRQAAQKRDGHGQAEAGQDPQTQQTQSSLRLTLGSLASSNN